MAHALRHDGRVATEEVHAKFPGGVVKRLGYTHIVVRGIACRAAHQRYWRYRYTLVHDRNTELLGYILSRPHEVFRETRYLVVYVVTELVEIAVGTVEQIDAHSDGAHVKVLTLYHLIGLKDLKNIYHP